MGPFYFARAHGRSNSRYDHAHTWTVSPPGRLSNAHIIRLISSAYIHSADVRTSGRRVDEEGESNVTDAERASFPLAGSCAINGNDIAASYRDVIASADSPGLKARVVPATFAGGSLWIPGTREKAARDVTHANCTTGGVRRTRLGFPVTRGRRSAMANKQYGLILPKKQQQSTAPRLGNVFGDDNDSDEDDSTDWVRKALKAESDKNRMKKQTKLDIQKALDEDPTIYQYDEIYDDLERGKEQDGASKQKEKKSKYIPKLLKTADRRKKEQEHRIERMVQKEREAEGEMYADKESFVTSAYRAKLEEFKKMEEEEAKMNRLEAIGDVTKQQDMSGFYRHLYEQTVDYKGEANEDGNDRKEESTEARERKTSTNDTNEESPTASKRANETEERQRTIAKSKKPRQYRQRAVEAYESDSETETSKEELKKDQTAVSPVDKEVDGAEVQGSGEKKQKLDETPVNAVENIVNTKNKDEDAKDVEIPQDNITPENEKIENKEKPVVKKEKSSIWEKRTVGPVFEAALQRYYARKAKRLAAAN